MEFDKVISRLIKAYQAYEIWISCLEKKIRQGNSLEW